MGRLPVGWAWAIGSGAGKPTAKGDVRRCRPLWLRCRVLSGFWARLRGLLGTDPDADPVIIERCRSVHTWGMRYAIDVALVAPSGRVVASARSMAPCRVLGAREASLAIERPSRPGRWFERGDEVRVERIQ